jgi:5-formyltetrahydrofolate cyclo-ligase
LSKVKASAKKVAVAHEFQVLNSIPTEEHDIKMDMIITEENEWKGDTLK